MLSCWDAAGPEKAVRFSDATRNHVPDQNAIRQKAENPAQTPPAWLRTRFLQSLGIDRLHRRYEKYLPVVTFAAGFIWDSLTLTRIDRMSDNLILLGYLAALAFMIVITLRRQAGFIRNRWIRKMEVHFRWVVQFLLGGLLSSYVVFYFKSASWTQTSLFFVLLVILLVGNEFLEHRLGNPKLLGVLFFFCLFSFLAFFLPIVVERIDTRLILLSQALGVMASLAVFSVAFPWRRPDWLDQMRPVVAWVVSTCLVLNFFYFANLIPPVPLALKSAGIFHYVAKTGKGYQVRYVPPPRYRFWKQWDDPFYLSRDEPAFCYTAIFAPRNIRVPVRHVWSQHSPSQGWTVKARVAFEIAGGREGGYRGYSRKSGLSPGRWRVEVETDRGQILGRIDFTIQESPSPHPALQTKIID